MADDFDPKYFIDDEAPQEQEMDPSLFEDEAPETSFGEKTLTAAEQMSDMRLAGYLPQLKAALETAIDFKEDLNAKLGLGSRADVERLKAQGFNIVEPGRGYTAARDRAIAEQRARAERNPISALIGSAGGLVGPSAVTGVAKGASKAAAAKGAGSGLAGLVGGATAGGAYNPGDTEGELGGLQIADRAPGAVIGGGLGGIAGKIGGTARSLARRKEVMKAMDQGEAGKLIAQRLKGVRESAGFSPDSLEGKLLKKLEKAPVNTLKATKRGTDLHETLLNIEKKTGLPLTQLSDDVTVTGKLGKDWRKFFHPLEAPAEIRTRGERAVYNIGGGLQNATGDKDILTRAILEGSREGRTK